MTILDRLVEHAARIGDETAFICLQENGPPCRLSYAELDRRVRSLAAIIRENARPGDRPLVLYPHGLEFIASFLACLYAGVIAVPAYPPRRNRSIDRLRAIAADCQPTLILTTQDVGRQLDKEFLNTHRISACIETDGYATEAVPTPTYQSPQLAYERIAFLQYTSGSTGEPKGTIVTHDNLLNNERSIQAAFCYCPATIMVSWLPLFHDMGLIGGVLQPLYVGFPSILLAPTLFVREPIRWLSAISEYRGTTTGAPNFAYDHCVDSVAEDQKGSLDLNCLTLAYNGAEPVRAAFAAAFAACGFDRKAFFPCYGMAETTLFTSGGPPLRDSALLRVSAAELESQIIVIEDDDCRESRTLVGCGHVGLDTRVVVVEPTSHRKLPADQIGEIWIDGGSVAKGYWNRAAETEETFRAMTADGDGPFLRTGDLGFLHDGQVYVTGRLKDLIIIRGRNIYPQDVEIVIEETTGFVKPNCCAAFSIEHGGVEGLAVALEANRELAREARSIATEEESNAHGHDLQPDQAADGKIAQVVNRIRERIAERFDITPVRITLLSPGTFPRTSSGKVQRRACKEGLHNRSLTAIYQWTAPLAAGASAGAAESQFERNGMEGQLGRHLVEIINRWIPSQPQIAARRVTANSSLKSLGLDSLAINSLALEIESNLCVRLAPDILFECDTVFAIACYLAGKRPMAVGALTEQPITESFDLRTGSHATNGVLHANGKSASNGYD